MKITGKTVERPPDPVKIQGGTPANPPETAPAFYGREKMDPAVLLKELSFSLAMNLKSSRIPLEASNERTLTPLLSVLNILAALKPEETGSRIQIIKRFLESWMEKYGDTLPGNRKKDLAEITNVLRSLQGGRLDGGQNILFSFGGTAPPGDRFWKLELRDKKESAKGEGEPECLLQLDTPNLGPVKVLISYNRQGSKCLFIPGEMETVRILKKNMKMLHERLKKRGLSTSVLKVGQTQAKLSEEKSQGKTGGIDLWG